jgi:hypothetical protein
MILTFFYFIAIILQSTIPWLSDYKGRLSILKIRSIDKYT